jgi:hypothetical protein
MTAPALAARLAAFETATLHKLGAARSYPRRSACGQHGDFESILERAEKRTRKEAQIMMQQVRNGRTNMELLGLQDGIDHG